MLAVGSPRLNGGISHSVPAFPLRLVVGRAQLVDKIVLYPREFPGRSQGQRSHGLDGYDMSSSSIGPIKGTRYISPAGGNWRNPVRPIEKQVGEEQTGHGKEGNALEPTLGDHDGNGSGNIARTHPKIREGMDE